MQRLCHFVVTNIPYSLGEQWLIGAGYFMEETTYDPSMGDVDVIFAGGGSAACVAAARLARAAPDLKILIIERGRNNLNDPMVVNSALAMAHLAPDSTTALVY
jgi:hypothetical protein